ncbi:MAG: histidine kinase [Mogibacterium sp.]|nr:histidine kinase [Mogibacterium sp.]
MMKRIHESLLLQMLLIIMIILLVFTGSLIISQNYIYEISRSNSETLCDNLMDQIDDSLSYHKDRLRYLASYYFRYPGSSELGEYDDGNDKSLESQLVPLYSQITSQSRDVVAMMVFDSHMHEVAHLGRPAALPEDRNYLRSNEDFDAGQYLDNDHDYSYAYYFPIYSTEDGKAVQTGMCVFIMEHWVIDGNIRNILKDHAASVMLSDSNNPVLAMYNGSASNESKTMEEMRNDSDYIYKEGEWDRGIKVATAVCISANTEGSDRIRNLVLLSYSVAIFLLVLLFGYSYLNMARPINQITEFINRAIRHPDDRLHMERKDDIGVVAASLDRMLDENQKMIEEIKEGKISLYETRLARQKMEILAYRNQINPHFLYNTLSCMRDMALIHDEDDIADMAMCLSDIFRYAVKGSNIVTFRDEIQYMEKYATIINYRFSGKISIVTDVAEEVLDKPAIRFLLQPLVENSVFHGLEESINPGTVSTRVIMNGDRIEITVEDDGVGMDEDTLEAVREMIEEPGESASIGLSNIVQRLRLFYEDDYSITVDSTEGVGTRIVISLPDHIRS